MRAVLKRLPAFAVAALAPAILSPPGCLPASDRGDLETAMAALRAEDLETARSLFERMRETQPGSATVHGNLGVVYWKQGQTDEALESLRTAADLATDDPRPLEIAGHILIRTEKWEDARHVLEEAYERRPDSPRILTRLGVVEYGAGNLAAAESLFSEALVQEPAYPPALFNLGILQLKGNGDTRAAAARFAEYLRAVEKSPALADAHHEQVQTARGYLNAARRARSEPPASEAILARVREAVEAQAYDEALIALNQAVEQYPDDPDLLWALAVLYDEQLGYARKARDVYRQFEWRFPDDPRSAEQRSRREIPEKTQPATSDPTAADESPEPAPDQPAPAEEPGKDADRRAQARKAFAAGLQAQRAGDLDRAIARYGKAVELDPFYAAASYNLGLALKAAGKLQPAADALRAAVSVRAEMTDARFMLAVVLQELGDTDAALREAQEVLAHSPDHARAHLLAGLLHRSRGDPAARGHLEQFVRLAPTDPAAKPVKEWLKKRGIPPDTEPD